MLKVTENDYAYQPDYNGSFEDGSFPLPLSNEDDRRVSTALGYLHKQARTRKNLHIFANAFVEGLTFDGIRATGARVTIDGPCLSRSCEADQSEVRRT